MKKLILLLVLFGSIVSAGVAQTGEEKAKDSIAKAAADKRMQDSLKETQRKAAATKAVCDSCPQKTCDTCTTKVCKPGTLVEGRSWWLVYTPVILFLLVVIYLLANLYKFDLKEALTENEYVKKTIQNAAYSPAAITGIAATNAAASISTVLPPTIEVTDIPTAGGTYTHARASSSRFIALVTSLITLILCVCLCSFFIYFYIATGTPPEIGKFSSVLLALGIGVVPYAFNKVAAAITNKPTTNE